jgi:hypothetical protein
MKMYGEWRYSSTIVDLGASAEVTEVSQNVILNFRIFWKEII